MSKKGVLSPLVFERHDASIVADLICERLRGAELSGTPFSGAFEFGQRLTISLSNARHRAKNRLAVYNVAPAIAEAAFRYLMLFTHDDTAHFLTDEQGVALIEVTTTIVLALTPGRKSKLTRMEIDARICAYRSPEIATVEVPDDRWYRRLQHRHTEAIREEDFWNQLATSPREPVPDFMKAYLVPKGDTE
jgi:hypothetical protein